MNGESFFRSTIGSMIGQGFAVDDVREKLFLKGASEVWGGEEMDAHPAWYFWLANSPGAYRLQLVDSGRLDEHTAVSYTHLDVYKRQVEQHFAAGPGAFYDLDGA